MFFNVSKESNENNHVTTILPCLDRKPRFFLTKVIFKIKLSLISHKSK